MADSSSGAPQGGEVVRGGGNAPGQSLGSPMPQAPEVEPRSLDSMKAYFAQKNRSPQQNPTPKQSPTRVGQFQDALDAQRQAKQGAQNPRPEDLQQDPSQSPPEQSQIVDNPEAGDDPTAAGEDPTQAGDDPEGQTQAQGELSDAEAAAKYREMLAGDMFPDDLLHQLHEVKANGMTRYVDGNELRQGYVRGVDYRKQQVEFQGRTQQMEAREQQWGQFWEDMRNPEQAVQILEREGYGDVLDQIAYLRAQRISEMRETVEAAGLAAMRRLGVQDPNDHRVRQAMANAEKEIRRAREVDIREARLQHQQQMLQRQQQSAQQSQYTEEMRGKYESQLNQLRPLALKAYQLKDNPANRMRFARHLLAAVQTSGGSEVTRELCMQAARDLADEDGDERERMTARAPQGRQAQPLPPGRSGGGAGKPLAGERAQRGTLRDLERFVNDQRRRR